MDSSLNRMIVNLRSAVAEAERLLNASAAAQAEEHIARLRARAAASDAGDAQNLFANLLELARLRLELFSVELHEEMNRQTLRLLAVIAGVTGAAFAALSLSFAMDGEFRVLGTAALSVLFAASALLAAWLARRQTRARQGRFFHSLAELREDLANLKP